MAEISHNVNATRLVLVRGDITRQQVDAIVNAANSRLIGGSGVDGAIHKAGGAEIMAECDQLRKLQGGCEPGQAVITTGGKLAARYVIHTVGPIWRGGTTNEAQILASAYRSSLSIAAQYEVKTLAFPAISTGAYGYPIDQAAQVAVNAVKEFCEQNQSLTEVRFVLFDDFALDAYKNALRSTLDCASA